MNASLHRERRLQAAQGYLALGMPDHALRELSAVPNPGPAAFVLHELRGEALRQKEEHGAALEAFARALEERPDDLGALLGFAWCCKRTGRLPRAIDAMERAYRAHPDEPIVLYNMACYLALGGDKAQALSWLGRALRREAGLRKLIPEESDFDSLRNDPDFQLVACGRLESRD